MINGTAGSSNAKIGYRIALLGNLAGMRELQVSTNNSVSSNRKVDLTGKDNIPPTRPISRRRGERRVEEDFVTNWNKTSSIFIDGNRQILPGLSHENRNPQILSLK